MFNASSPFSALAGDAQHRVRVEFWAIVGCVVLFLAILELVRRNKLKERYSLLWFLTVGVLGALTVRRSWLEDFASLMGVYYPPTALFLLLVFFMLLILIHFSIVISQLLTAKQTLAQEVGILESRVHELEKKLEGSSHALNTSSNGDEILR